MRVQTPMLGQRRFWTSLAFCVSVFACSICAEAQDMPKLDANPVDVTDAFIEAGDNPRASALILSPGYQSIMLDAKFHTQTMRIRRAGRVIDFWGARIVEIGPNSPLHALNLKVNDVVTRLDGRPIWQRMSRMTTDQGDTWRLPEMESHYGRTKVRYIHHKTQTVLERPVDLGPHRTTTSSGPAPIDP